MNKTLAFLIFTALLFASCAGNPRKQVLNFTESPGIAEIPGNFTITDYKDRGQGSHIPLWVAVWLNSGVEELEALDTYRDYYVFVSRNEGYNFNALNEWARGFSADLDFPRLAAARIEKRFSASVPFPDNEYGSFYETLIRAASDAHWIGADRKDDFWIRREYPSGSGEDGTPDRQFLQDAGLEDSSGHIYPNSTNWQAFVIGPDLPSDRETWEFLILVTINKSIFAAQVEELFENIKPNPRPSREQTNAANRVKDRFFDGF